MEQRNLILTHQMLYQETFQHLHASEYHYSSTMFYGTQNHHNLIENLDLSENLSFYSPYTLYAPCLNFPIPTNYDSFDQLPLFPQHGYPTTSAFYHGAPIPSGSGPEASPRYSRRRAFPSHDSRRYQSQRRRVPQVAQGENRPHLRMLLEDEVAILNIPRHGDFLDQHRHVDALSYEDLLLLEDQIGKVNNGLSEEIINHGLRTRTYVASVDANEDSETETCVICQADYENQENIGMLDCGHNYHSECIKKWLLVKNECPLCKKYGIILGE